MGAFGSVQVASLENMTTEGRSCPLGVLLSLPHPEETSLFGLLPNALVLPLSVFGLPVVISIVPV
jgi:hypothetical protein